MKRTILLTLALLTAGALRAGTVYVTAHGKTYHTERTCMSLAKSAHVLATDDKTAAAHGLRECGICAHRSGGAGKTSGKKKNDNGAFAREVQ